MPSRAPRLPARLLHALARGAVLAVCLLPAAMAAAQVAVSARYEGETTRYPHGVLGDEIEYDTLAVTLSNGRVLRMRWEPPLVFEDVAPRLWDMDGDGAPEIVTVESHEELGARLGFWSVDGDRLAPVAATGFIGTRFRWLAPVGAADFDGDGRMEFAYVDRPHLARTLRIWRYEPSGSDGVRLRPLASLDGVSNHRIGWDYIAGGLRDCGAGPEMVLASGDWQSVLAIRFDGDLTRRSLGAYSDARMRAALDCR